ncbi:scarecrow-like protein 8, partial [Ananas comosus]|uniref:Scarecrow-like protein 8 n=1 Tax=Ananas comosus TaxID=4615 RepID=A0A6P5EFS1_ANACO
MASGFPGRDSRGSYAGFGGGSAVQIPFQGRSDGGGGGGGAGVLKRTLSEMERRQQQMALQQALFLRSVKQKIHMASPLSSDLGSLTSPSSISSGCLVQGGPQRGWHPAALESDRNPKAATESAMRNQLHELERRLLGDDEEELEEATASGSAVTGSEWGETMRQLISISAAPSPSSLPPPPPPMANQSNPLSPSPSPSNSSSSNSTASSTASCSTPPPSNPSRQLLSDAAAAVAEGNLAAAAASLAAVRRAASPRGDAEQRLAAMMAAALASRLDPPAPSGAHPAADLFAAEHRFATQLLHDASPCFKLGLAVANLAILEAARGHPKLHVVDFDVGSGAQHAELIRALAERRPRPASLKITAVADPAYPLPAAAAKGLRDVGDRLSKLADRAGVGLRFSIVSLRAAELDRASLGCEPDEALAVNLAFVLSRIADESVSPANPRDELLRRV